MSNKRLLAFALTSLLAGLTHFLDDLDADVLALGENTSGEHGIGITKQRFLMASTDPEIVKVSRAIKRTLDRTTY